MGFYPPQGGGSGVNKGTAAARPAAAALQNQLYWATDTNEISFSDGTAWSSLGKTSAFFAAESGIRISADVQTNLQRNGATGNIQAPSRAIEANGFVVRGGANPVFENTVAGNEAAAATAGAAALPANPVGFFLAKDSGGIVRKDSVLR